MRKILLLVTLSAFTGALPAIANAHGCIKGAAVGGLVGHVAGHHGLAGAAVGCALGHHRAKVKARELAQAQAATRVQPAK